MDGWRLISTVPSRTLAGMASKRTTGGKSPAELSVVGAQEDTRTPAQKRMDGLRKAQAARKANIAARKASREPGWRSNLDKYLNGEYPVADWTDEEVQRGRPEGKDGFSGTFPKFTGRQHSEIKRELLKRGQRRIDSLYSVAIDALADVARNGENESARAKAAELLIQRTAGKVPERIEVKSSDPWQDILDDIMTDEVLQRVKDGAAQAD